MFEEKAVNVFEYKIYMWISFLKKWAEHFQ